jgi:hypothetical protein
MMASWGVAHHCAEPTGLKTKQKRAKKIWTYNDVEFETAKIENELG